MRSTDEQIAAEAIDWFLRLAGAPVTAQDRQAFSEWLLRSPAHIQEYLQVSCTWDALQVGSEGDLQIDALIAAAKDHHDMENVVRLRGGAGAGAGGDWKDVHLRAHALTGRSRRRVRPESGHSDAGRFEGDLSREVRSRDVRSGPSENEPSAGDLSGHRFSRRGWAMALAASLVLGVGLWAACVSWYSATTFRTAVGEQRSFVLQDGSVIFLNTDSKVRVRLMAAERHIDLIRGEARFQVTKDPSRPFTVTTTDAAVRALGTIFNVRADPPSTQVAVLEGQVEVVAAAREAANESQVPDPAGHPAQGAARPSIRLAAGQRAAVTSLGIEAEAGPSIEAVVAWTQRRLVFRDQALSAVVREFNRYRTQPLVIDDPELAALKISGAFDLSDTDSLIAFLGSYEGVQVDRMADGSQHLSRRPQVK